MDSTTFHLGDLVNSLISITSSKIEEINSKIDQEDPDSLKKSISGKVFFLKLRIYKTFKRKMDENVSFIKMVRTIS